MVRGGLKILLDTNMFIASEAITADVTDVHADDATRLRELAEAGGHVVFLSASTADDLSHDSDPGRSAARLLQFRKYSKLEPLRIPVGLATRAGYAEPLSPNDQVDVSMLAALESDAADLLVTQDGKLRGHAARLGFADQAISARDAIDLLLELAAEPTVLPTLTQQAAYRLDLEDPIFTTLRDDYDGFDEWIRKARREHRDCLVLQSGTEQIDGLVILKAETDRPYGLGGDVLKVCTMKVADRAAGAKRGELLLRGIFDYARNHQMGCLYLEVLPKHTGLLELLSQFGFEPIEERSTKGELVMVKNLTPSAVDLLLPPFEFHRRYGPGAMKLERAFVVPIEPRWHDVLFPERSTQQDLFGPHSSGNALRKAYLCRAPTQQLQQGDALLFYKSIESTVEVVGVVDRVERLETSAEVAAVVGRRTVYDMHEIERLCTQAKAGVLTILFRWDRFIAPPWRLKQLRDAKVLKAHPQSITRVQQEDGLRWLQEQLLEPP